MNSKKHQALESGRKSIFDRARKLDQQLGTLKPCEDSCIKLIQDAYDLGMSDRPMDPRRFGGLCDLCGGLTNGPDAFPDRITIEKFYRDVLEDKYWLDICSNCREHLENHMFTMKVSK